MDCFIRAGIFDTNFLKRVILNDSVVKEHPDPELTTFPSWRALAAFLACTTFNIADDRDISDVIACSQIFLASRSGEVACVRLT